MTYGFTIRNETNIVTVDDNHAGFVSMQSGSVSVGTDLQNGVVVSHPNYNNAIPLILLRPPYGVTVSFASLSSNWLTFTQFRLAASTSCTVQYHLFWLRSDIGSLNVSNDYGISVWNDSSALVFSSDRVNLNIDFIANVSNWEVTHAVPTPELGFRYMMLNSTYRYLATYDSFYDNILFRVYGVKLLSETSISTGHVSKNVPTGTKEGISSVKLLTAFPANVCGYIP